MVSTFFKLCKTSDQNIMRDIVFTNNWELTTTTVRNNLSFTKIS